MKRNMKSLISALALLACVGAFQACGSDGNFFGGGFSATQDVTVLDAYSNTLPGSVIWSNGSSSLAQTTDPRGISCEDPPEDAQFSACLDDTSTAQLPCSQGGSTVFQVAFEGVTLGSFTLSCTGTAQTVNLDLPTLHEVFVANYGNGSITVHDIGATGDVAPLRVITGGLTTLGSPTGVFVVQNEIFVAGYAINNIAVFAADADGDVAPIREITGANTGLSAPAGISVSGDEIFVGNESSDAVTVYDRTDNGNVAPIRTITGASTALGSAVGVSVFNDELFVSDQSGKILVFDPQDQVNVAPVRNISGVNTTMSIIYSIFPSSEGIFIANFNTNGANHFGINDDGNVAPNRTISGGSTNISHPGGVSAR